MKCSENWYLPDNEYHFTSYLKEVKETKLRGTYQQVQRDKALSYVKDYRVAIDIGSCVGFWAKDLCCKFKKVFCFEPYLEASKCLNKNLQKFDNYEILNVALSNDNKTSNLFVSEDGIGSNSLNKNNLNKVYKNVTIKTKKLDNFKFLDVDFVKIDVQEHEYEVLLGAIETLKNNSPILCVECTTRDSKSINYVIAILNLLKSLDFELITILQKEYIFKKGAKCLI